MGAPRISFMKAFLLLAGLGVAFISVGGHALYEWYETGQMPLHHGFHRTVSYADDPFSFTYEFGGNVFIVSMGIAAVFGAILAWVLRVRRKTS
jgi:hypothetical protein